MFIIELKKKDKHPNDLILQLIFVFFMIEKTNVTPISEIYFC